MSGTGRPRPGRNADPRPTPPDAGAVQLLIFLGWVPTGVTALIGGVIVGLRTGSVGRALITVVGGTVVGWIAVLVLVFTVGWYLEQHGRLPRTGIFESIAVGFGVLVTIAFAVLIG
jgi:hypothetical protein